MTKMIMPTTRFEATREAFLNALNEAVEVKFGALDKMHADYFNKELELIKNVPDEWLTTMLIVSDMTKYMKWNYPNCISSDRGAIVSSFAAYLLDITGIDPVLYNLIPERFYVTALTNPIPMIDLDIATSCKEAAINYLQHVYGEECVFGCMCDVYKNGTIINRSKHACALFISAEPYTGKINEMYADETVDELMAQGHMRINLVTSKPQEEIMKLSKGCDKFDPMMFKGMYNVLFDGAISIPYELTLRYASRYLKTFEDLVMSISISRPHGLRISECFKKRDSYGDDNMDEILAEINGHIVYQEQVCQLLQYILGINFMEANNLRKSIAKKNMIVVNDLFANIIPLLINKGFYYETVINFWNDFVHAAIYGVSKAHFTVTAYDIARYAWLQKQMK